MYTELCVYTNMDAWGKFWKDTMFSVVTPEEGRKVIKSRFHFCFIKSELLHCFSTKGILSIHVHIFKQEC